MGYTLRTASEVRKSKAEYVFPKLLPENNTGNGYKPVANRTAMPDSVTSSNTARLDSQVKSTVLSFLNFHQYGELFINYLRARKDTFIVHKGWNLPEVDGMEFDQYDTPRARWVVIHEYGEILAGVRIAPTTAQCGQHSYMIRDAQLGRLDGLAEDVLFFDAPVDDHIWEATRLFVAQSVPANRRLRIQTMLLEEMAAAARDVGATHVLGIVPAVFRRWMNRLGMTAVPVGPVLKISGDETQAALMNVSVRAS